MKQRTGGIWIIEIVFKSVNSGSKFPNNGVQALSGCPQRLPPAVRVEKLIDSNAD
jgi:hypothetical protein